MKRSHWSLLLTTAPLALALGAAATPALGADLPVKAQPVVKAPVAAPFSWTGWYIGANAGFGVGQGYGTYASPAGAFEAFNAMPAGGFGGGQLGYNYQLFGSFVIGAETDIQGAGLSDDRTCLAGCTAAFFATIDHKLNWFGTTRARIGLATGPVLSYFTGGVAYGGVETGVTTPASSLTNSATRTGGTWGAGIEASLGGNWTAKAEYLYINLGSTGVTSAATGALGVKNQEQLFRGGLNYRFGAAQPADLPPVRNWAGFYAGATFGAGIGRNDSTFAQPNLAAEAFFLSPRGWDVGGLAGYNWQFGHWVLGIEGDFQGSTGTGYLTSLADGTTTIDQKLSSFGTVRGRLGYGAGDALFYVTGGAAFGEVKESITQGAAAGSFSHSKSGFAAGGGIENRLEIFGLLGPNWTTRTEYLFIDLGSVSDAFAGQTLTSNIHEHVWRTVVSYKF